MNFQQLRYVRETVRQGLNLTEAAKKLFTSQPGVSKQIRELENELGVEIFVRHGKRIVAVTEPGKAVVEVIERLLQEAENLRQVGREFKDQTAGTLTIATTHTQARYSLPKVVGAFKRRYPKVHLTIKQGNPPQLAEMVIAREADMAIATEALDNYPKLLALPGYEWRHCVVVPVKHPLAKEQRLTLETLARYPIVTYDPAFAGRSRIDEAFRAQGLAPNIVLAAAIAKADRDDLGGQGRNVRAVIRFPGRSVPGRRDAECGDRGHGVEGFGKRAGVAAVGRVDHHVVFEGLPVARHAVIHIGDDEALPFHHGAQLGLGHGAVAKKPHREIRVELDRHLALDPAKTRKHDERQRRPDAGGEVESHADHDTDCGGDPDRGRGGEAADRQAFFHDHPGAQETDAGHDPLRHSGWIDADLVQGQGREPGVLVDGENHQHAGRQAHERVGAKARGPAVIAALQADDSARRERDDQVQRDRGVGIVPDRVYRHASTGAQ